MLGSHCAFFTDTVYPFFEMFQIGQEAKACRTSAAAFNMSYFAKYYISGPDAQKAVDWIFTANMQKAAGKLKGTTFIYLFYVGLSYFF